VISLTPALSSPNFAASVTKHPPNSLPMSKRLVMPFARRDALDSTVPSIFLESCGVDVLIESIPAPAGRRMRGEVSRRSRRRGVVYTLRDNRLPWDCCGIAPTMSSRSQKKGWRTDIPEEGADFFESPLDGILY